MTHLLKVSEFRIQAYPFQEVKMKIKLNYLPLIFLMPNKYQMSALINNHEANSKNRQFQNYWLYPQFPFQRFSL